MAAVQDHKALAAVAASGYHKKAAAVKGKISTNDADGWIADHVNKEMYAENRRRVMAACVKALGGEAKAAGHVVVLQGGTTLNKYDTDGEFLFRQESHFYYLFGCPEPDVFGALDLQTQQSILFLPSLFLEYTVWCGEVKPPAFYKAKYGVDEVRYIEELPKTLFAERKLTSGLHILSGKNSDSGLTIPPVKYPEDVQKAVDAAKVPLRTDVFYHEICECRVIKSERELNLMRHINAVSSDAHVVVMREAGTCKTEHELESIFTYNCYRFAGCRHMSYTCICCSGENGAVLHYGHAGAPNDKKIVAGDMLLLDMGAEYHGYASDITCSYPATGKFSPQQKAVYEAVLAAQTAVFKAMKPGVLWSDMHRLSERVLVQHLIAIGLVHIPSTHSKTTIDDLLETHHIGAVFMPHGLGHLLGLDTHDVGGYPPHEAKRIDRPGLRKLRFNRILKPGMVLTVEPGCYFIDALITKALADPNQAPFLNGKKIAEYANFGGIRLEDDVIVTHNGMENMTKCPRSVAEIEAVMAGGAWPKAVKPASEYKLTATASATTATAATATATTAAAV